MTVQRRSLLLYLAVALSARPDTLVLRNGVSVTGAWAGVNSGEVSFLVNNSLQTYPRSDVLSVAFGPAQLAGKTPAPELIGVLYFQDTSQKLVPLERAKAQLKYTHWQVEGAASSVRLPATPKISFIVSLAAGIDPGVFILTRLETIKGARHVKFNPVPLAVNVTNFGESSYALTPASDLAPGEYAFIRQKTNDFHCFGVGTQ